MLLMWVFKNGHWVYSVKFWPQERNLVQFWLPIRDQTCDQISFFDCVLFLNRLDFLFSCPYKFATSRINGTVKVKFVQCCVMKCTPIALHAKAPPIPNTLVQPHNLPLCNHHSAPITSVLQHLLLRENQSLGIQTDTNYSLLYSH